jgi:hypothetical protein
MALIGCRQPFVAAGFLRALGGPEDRRYAYVALPWVIHCQAEVKNGILHAEHGTKEGRASRELNGKIAADGTATLSTTGLATAVTPR